MDYTKSLKEVYKYYQNLLIIQYHNKPRAKATIKSLIDRIMSNLLMLQVRDGFDLETAVGKQLDILGEWVGVDRTYSIENKLFPYFSLINWEQTTESNEQGGFSLDWDETELDDAGFLSMYEYINTNSTSLLSDNDYRLLIKLKIIKNVSTHTMGNLDTLLNNYFGTDIYIDWVNNNVSSTETVEKQMTLTYCYKPQYNAIIKAALQKNILPVPMGMFVEFKTVE